MEKVNYPKSTLFYVNQAHLTVEKNENIIYADHSIIGEIIPAANVPSDVENYECGPEEFKVIMPVFGINAGSVQKRRIPNVFSERFSATTEMSC